MNLSKPSPYSAADVPGLLYASFNQDYGCFSCGLDTGFRIYNCDPLKEKMRKEFEDGGICIVEMLFRCNILALVGGGKNPKYPPNKVIIWDDQKNRAVIELEFRSEVKAVKLRREKFVVALNNKVIVYSFDQNPTKLHVFETVDNDRGLVALSSSEKHAILIFPGRQSGHIQIVDLNNIVPTTAVSASAALPSSQPNPFSSNPQPKYPMASTRPSANISIIPAHTSPLFCLVTNADGTKCASASDKGTLIRVFDTGSSKLLHEFRRGVDRAEIYSIAFNSDSTRICAGSDKGTVHIFNLEGVNGSRVYQSGVGSPSAGPHYGEVIQPHHTTHMVTGNRQSSLAFMKDLLPKYFSSAWSFAQFKVAADCRCICAFGGEKNTVIVICADGSFYRFMFDPQKGGECVRESYRKFLKDSDDD
ncbi:WD repeat domain phosphoinositide-interacting protein 3 [Lobosporangium transversale]|uniref:WD40-repeat-containing domain protein n=1 Tax=Lobosporangium transversale TaxID=64571 RepID=A0A1Y2GTE5_9FUNG|nr:WD40-repeat-containing domain protein [Lobosporangium transversale]KAF9917624.1 WD repeat domain phosphoinositide-interacting protein 3 [Lobosporangium transversale]ORZ22779.1 WD40-repeat-containing domain protein [Lobosporangium transversale]|eukprot:XP_021883333.1 WD40-repeat-containing domain protein [Lobosporangium transversale]